VGSDADFVAYVLDQIPAELAATTRKMFGEYGLFVEGRMPAMICDNQLFVKITEAGRQFLGDVPEAPPYPGAKPAFLMGEEIEDPRRLGELLRITAEAMPPPRRKRK